MPNNSSDYLANPKVSLFNNILIKSYCNNASLLSGKSTGRLL